MLQCIAVYAGSWSDDQNILFSCINAFLIVLFKPIVCLTSLKWALCPQLDIACVCACLHLAISCLPQRGAVCCCKTPPPFHSLSFSLSSLFHYPKSISHLFGFTMTGLIKSSYCALLFSPFHVHAVQPLLPRFSLLFWIWVIRSSVTDALPLSPSPPLLPKAREPHKKRESRWERGKRWEEVTERSDWLLIPLVSHSALFTCSRFLIILTWYSNARTRACTRRCMIAAGRCWNDGLFRSDCFGLSF